MATRSVRLTSGFHASASDELHVHIVEPINILEEEFWSPDKNKNKYSKNIITNNIDIIENENITIFPNPINDIVKIKSKKEKLERIEITDITGKLVALYQINSLLNYQIDLSAQTNGIYILKIQTENEILTKKIIKQ